MLAEVSHGCPFVFYGRVQDASGGNWDLLIDPAPLAKAAAMVSVRPSVEQLLTLAQEFAKESLPPDSRLIAITCVGFGPAPVGSASLLKADFDEGKHPRWPAKSPDSQGGQFRPKDAESSPPSDEPSVLEVEPPNPLIEELVRRLAKRELRRIARDEIVDSLKTLVSNAVPILGEIKDVLRLIKFIKDIKQLYDLSVDVNAAVDFAKTCPRTLASLHASQTDESFSSYGQFLKGLSCVPWTQDMLEKRFGPAGNGYEYHHIVEQGGANARNIPQSQLQSTENIVRIPTLLHQAINAAYGMPKAGTNMTVRQWLATQPFEAQRAYGIKTMKELGIIN